MNTRIEEGSIRFRLTPDDYRILLEGKDVVQRIKAGRDFYVAVIPVTGKTRLDISGEGLTLCVSAESLKDLGDLGRSKYGISFKQGDAEISLQIDLKLQKNQVA